METLLNKLNLQLSDNNKQGVHTTFCVINNSDGSPRWVCNSKSNVPHFLNFYLISSFRSWMFAFAIRVVFFLRLQKFVFRTINVRSKYSDNGTSSIVNFSNTNWAIFTGTVGVNNKMLLYEETENEYKYSHKEYIRFGKYLKIAKVESVLKEMGLISKMRRHNPKT